MCLSWSILFLLLVQCVFSSLGSPPWNPPTHCHQSAVLKGLYRSLHGAINMHAICDSDRPTTSIELLSIGKPLSYSDYNPGRPSKFTPAGTLPLSVVEKALPLVDKIYPAGTMKFDMLTNQSAMIESYRFRSLASMYEYVLMHMMLLPQNFTEEEVLRAKFYLQELVPNPERVLRNESALPRFLIYDHYRSSYLQKKAAKSEAIERTRRYSSQRSFEQWGQKELASLESDAEAAYNKWQAFGYKADVERQLQYFEDDIQEEKLQNARASFKASGQISEQDAHVTIYPFTLEPADWFHHLEVSSVESADQLRYRKSLLLTQQTLLNSTKNELNSKTSSDVNATLLGIQNSLSDLRTLIEGGVDKLLQMEVECFTRVNLTVCGDIIGGHTAFRALLQDIAEHYAQAEYLESLLVGKSTTIKVLTKRLVEVTTELRMVDALIAKAEETETEMAIDMRTDNDADVSSCPDEGQVRFSFDSRGVDVEEMCDEEGEGEGEEEEGSGGDDSMDCIDVQVPANTTINKMWNVHSCSIENELKSFGHLRNFTNLMDSAPIKISASLLKVKVRRPWFQVPIFEDSEHFTMKRGRGDVSPGPLSSKAHFLQVAHSGQYLLPHYVSAFIVASDITIFFPGLGSWNYSNYESETTNAINILMKFSYAQSLTGAIGPFSFEVQSGTKHNFNIQRKDGGLLIKVPGGQVVAYAMDIVPRFPHNQAPPFSDPMACDEHSDGAAHRRKRSADYDAPGNLRGLAKSLFTDESLARGRNQGSRNPDLARVVSSDYIEELIKDGEVKKEKVSSFIKSQLQE